MRTKYIYALIGFIFFNIFYSQVGIGTVVPATTSVLELNSTNKGLVLSYVALSSTILPSPFTSNFEGMLVYNTQTAGTSPNNVMPGIYYNDGAKWVRMTIDENIPKIGDIKPSVLTTDHDGWYLLNGRNVSTLSTSARANATALGFATTLPNSSDRILKGKNTSEALAATGGSDTFTLSQANLPNLTFTGNTSTDGLHSHSYFNFGNTYWNYNAGSSPALRFTETETRTTDPAGDHNHTISVPSGGSGTAITQKPKYLVTQYFIYFGK